MIVVIGASASGKTEIAKILTNKFNIEKCITTTTRLKRPNEVNHIDYHFIDKKSFLNLIKKGKFVEHAIYNNNYYGINKDDVKTNSIVIVEPNGANSLIKAYSEKTYIVYVKSLESVRKSRMLKRGDDVIDVNMRIESDKLVFKKSNINRIDLVISNNHFCSLDSLAKKIYKKYQKFLEKK